MAIEVFDNGGYGITGQQDIALFRLLSMKGRLKLEIMGMKSRGPSAATILKKEFGWKGNNKKILELLEAHLEELKENRDDNTGTKGS